MRHAFGQAFNLNLHRSIKAVEAIDFGEPDHSRAWRQHGVVILAGEHKIGSGAFGLQVIDKPLSASVVQVANGDAVFSVGGSFPKQLAVFGFGRRSIIGLDEQFAFAVVELQHAVNGRAVLSGLDRKPKCIALPRGELEKIYVLSRVQPAVDAAGYVDRF